MATIRYDKNKAIKISAEIFPDNICEQCGRCCITHVFKDGDGIPVIVYCEHYNPKTKLCNIYYNRFEKEDSCLSMIEGILAQAFPKDCPYVKDLKNYSEPNCYKIIRDFEKRKKGKFKY
ncbi:conserved hypothetical protein [Methanococcus aeolicus Nankai-3]|uniref:Flagellin N-methylase n=1 Tax=Methanococcus aeolicus (strain ATCC BAA-1280 / DSM 17508 / OCM 812 / Nankai-3) TaxID=419665 RepID=A6UX44_META3|nr:hypothetical protein [Methanococcus aeolicus]ABR57066.1 conserved hypothetical protein [Methanococcus aeolicus Nankai-3]